MAAKKEVAEAKEQLPAEFAGYEEYAGSGFENQTSDDYAIPFLNILQALSPQLQDPENEALKQGMIFNTVTGEAFMGKDGVAFVPCYTQHNYVEFKPRDSGGGFVGTHEVNSPLVQDCMANQEFGTYKTPDGNDLIETFYVYGIAVEGDGSGSEAVIAFTSTKIKKYKAWMTKAKTIQIQLPGGRRIPAPLFAHKYRLKTVGEKNSKGNFFNWDIAFDGPDAMSCRLSPQDELFQQAVACKGMIEAGTARAAYETQSATVGEGEDGAGGQRDADGRPVF